MKRAFSVIIVILTLITVSSGACAAPGSSPDDPIIITTAAQLDAVRNDPDKYYKLANDIDLTSYLEPGGAGYAKWDTSGWEPIGDDFTGGLDGAGHKITGLWIDRSYMMVGLFTYTINATICNLGIEISDRGIKGKYSVGGLVVFALESSITNCYVTGNVTADGGDRSVMYIGGLVGTQRSGSITNCYATGNVTAIGDFHSLNVGGLVGSILNCSITNCYATGNVIGRDRVGGLVGEQSTIAEGNSSITNCYATGNVSGINYVGGLVGMQYTYDNSIANCYATGNVSGGMNTGGLVGEQRGSDGINAITSSFRYQFAKVNGAVLTENTPNGIHGGTVTEEQLMTRSTYTGNGWVFNPEEWQWDAQGFAKLGLGDEIFPFSAFATPLTPGGGRGSGGGGGGGGCNSITSNIHLGLFGLLLSRALTFTYEKPGR